jgi:ElaB/YqjD/DUF883 family membrane-anchored ribosome-binding protein
MLLININFLPRVVSLLPAPSGSGFFYPVTNNHSPLQIGINMQNFSNSTNANSIDQGADAQSAANSKHDASSGLVREFNNFVADVEDLIKSTTQLTGEDLAKAKAKLNERVSAAKESMAEMGETIANRTRKTAADANDYVHEKPWNAVGISVAVGFLLGYLISRRG